MKLSLESHGGLGQTYDSVEDHMAEPRPPLIVDNWNASRLHNTTFSNDSMVHVPWMWNINSMLVMWNESTDKIEDIM